MNWISVKDRLPEDEEAVLDEPEKEQKAMRKKEINGTERLVPDCYTDENDNFPKRSWGAGIAQCVKSDSCQFSLYCSKEKGLL